MHNSAKKMNGFWQRTGYRHFNLLSLSANRRRPGRTMRPSFVKAEGRSRFRRRIAWQRKSECRALSGLPMTCNRQQSARLRAEATWSYATDKYAASIAGERRRPRCTSLCASRHDSGRGAPDGDWLAKERLNFLCITASDSIVFPISLGPL